MSPLIATVLLMAFAVALGGMIMNWSVEIGVNDECQDLQSEISVTQFCTRNDNIILRAASSEDAPPIQNVKLTIFSGDYENTVNVKNSELTPSNTLELSIPATIDGESRVDLIGVVGPKGKPYVCTETPIERVDPIRPC